MLKDAGATQFLVSQSEAERLKGLRRSLRLDEALLSPAEREQLAMALAPSPALQKVVDMRRELTALWGRSMASRVEATASGA